MTENKKTIDQMIGRWLLVVLVAVTLFVVGVFAFNTLLDLYISGQRLF